MDEESINWSSLGDSVRDRFDGSIPHLTFRCEEVRTDGTATGCYIIRFMRFLGTAFPAPGQHRAADIHVDLIEPGRRSWRRGYYDQRGRSLRLDTVKSEKGNLIEERSGFLSIILKPEIGDKGLVLTSERFDLTFGPVRIPLPKILTPGRLVVEHRDEGDGRFVFDMRLVNTRLGEIFVHRGEFKDIRA